MENPPHIFISDSSQDRSLVEKSHPTDAVLPWKQSDSTFGVSKRVWKPIRAQPAGRGKLLSPWRIATLSV
ncbi:hypothetical protein L0337_27685 [candidate division KSB1 bacterium]|nr:hypothetical protein [candidate division KSB1 bacterium]